MKKPDLPFLTWSRVKRGGKVYEYWQYRKGKTRRTLGPRTMPLDDLLKAYWLVRSGKATPSGRTFDDLILSYKQSPRYPTAARTRQDYERVLDYLREKVGAYDCRQMERHKVIEAQQALAAKGRARFGNYVATILSVLFEHAIDLGWRTTNPAKGVKKIRTGEGYHPWPDWAMAAFRREASGPVLLAFELALGTGQRISDVLAMRWDALEDDGINLRQAKTGEELWVPLTDHLNAVLAAAPRSGLTIVSGEHGRPLSYQMLEKRLRCPRKRAGAEAYSLHGLRYNATQELYEAGCTDAQVQAITGHRTRQMAIKYGKGVRQRKLARQVREIRKGQP